MFHNCAEKNIYNFFEQLRLTNVRLSVQEILNTKVTFASGPRSQSTLQKVKALNPNKALDIKSNLRTAGQS